MSMAREGRRRRRAAVAWLRWWVASMLLWWLLTSTIKVQEAVAGFGAAAVAATAMVAIRGSTPSLARFRVRWLKPVWLWPAVVIRDMAGLAGVLWRQLTEGRMAHGSFRE